MSRVKIIFRDLGQADGVAGNQQRSGDELRTHLTTVAAAHAVGVRFDDLWPSLNTYTQAYRRAVRNHTSDAFVQVATSTPPEIVCRRCEKPVPSRPGVIAEHVTSIAHVIRAFAEPRKVHA